MAEQDFFVGYQPEMPRDLGSYLRPRIAALLVLVGLLAAGLALSQQPYGASTFEFGVETELEGRLEVEPVPLLVVERPAGGGQSLYLLTVFGKRDARPVVEPHEGRRVRLRGALIHRDDQVMVEVVPDSIELLEGAASPGREVLALGEVTLEGEVVDSKCFLGVMNPGSTKPHRACATLCIRGGVPPVLLVRDEAGGARYLLLTDAEGGALNEWLVEQQLVAEPVRVRGQLERRGSLEVLRVEGAGIERLLR